ncbi:hypothetical protein B0H11DRAFT_2214122 [Mycena galericulata]|nr:hypothetical protein B0H11DRAFT_2214122 [Mycena galericulata]
MDPVSLPHEIWLYIHRLATSDSSPLVAARSERYQYAVPSDPLNDSQEFLRDTRSFVLVSRLWNSLANELLYENVRVNERFDSLYAALLRPENASLVRSIRLSISRFDHNCAILALCPQVQVVCHPNPSLMTIAEQDMASDTRRLDALTTGLLQFPVFLSLRHIYWTESVLASRLLRALLPSAPNVEHIFLEYAPSVHSYVPIPALPALPSLRRLSCPDSSTASTLRLFDLDLTRLARLTCAPSHLLLPEFPALLPALTTLELFGSRQTISFDTVFARCPRLRELCYDVWNRPAEPQLSLTESPAPGPGLRCVRLHSAVTVVRNWGLIDAHFRLLLEPWFPPIQRVVLYGTWHRVVADARFVLFRDGLRARKCEVEFPEGVVR